VPRPNQRSREAILNNGEGASSDVPTHSSKEGIKGSKKRHKQRLQGVATMIGNDGEAGGSDMRCSSTVTHSDKCQARPPMDHFKRHMDETCPNHAYPVRHKLKECVMMRSFITSGSLTWGAELDEGSDGSNTTHFPRENAVLTVYGGCPH
jgi:hypothetical protein